MGQGLQQLQQPLQKLKLAPCIWLLLMLLLVVLAAAAAACASAAGGARYQASLQGVLCCQLAQLLLLSPILHSNSRSRP
jgi:hypothetical protein